MRRPTLAVVMPNYDHARYLPRSIEAIAEQTRPPDEFLILDDASTDNSLEIIEHYASRYPFIRVFRNEQNEGVNRANRRLFEATQTDYLHAAAADDYRFPTFFEQALAMAEQHPAAGLIFGEVVTRNEADEDIGHVRVSRWQQPLFATPEQYLEDYLEAELATQSASSATIYRRSAFEEVGWYRTELGPWADTFAARAVALKYGACYVPEPFSADYRLPGSYSQQAKDDPRRALDVIVRAAALMRSAEFADRFPAAHVRRWERQYRRLVAWNYLLGDYTSQARSSFLQRNAARVPRLAGALRLLFYRGDATRPV